jgi:Protein of unknown function (DUF4038)
MLPTWGDKWNQKWGVGPEIFTPESAHAYGAFLGRRYAQRPIIWILGGDRPIETEAHRLVVRAMAAGLRAGEGGRHLLGFHSWGHTPLPSTSTTSRGSICTCARVVMRATPPITAAAPPR